MSDGVAFFLLLFSLGVYFLPAVIAADRHHPQAVPIFILTLFLGWTGLAWVGALAWSCARINPDLTRK